MVSEAGLLKVLAPSTRTVIDYTAEAEVVPATIRIDEGLEVAGKQTVVDGSTPFSAQSAEATSRASETGSKRQAATTLELLEVVPLPDAGEGADLRRENDRGME
jgi:hypothetical protein